MGPQWFLSQSHSGYNQQFSPTGPVTRKQIPGTIEELGWGGQQGLENIGTGIVNWMGIHALGMSMQ